MFHTSCVLYGLMIHYSTVAVITLHLSRLGDKHTRRRIYILLHTTFVTTHTFVRI